MCYFSKLEQIAHYKAKNQNRLLLACTHTHISTALTNFAPVMHYTVAALYKKNLSFLFLVVQDFAITTSASAVLPLH